MLGARWPDRAQARLMGLQARELAEGEALGQPIGGQPIDRPCENAIERRTQSAPRAARRGDVCDAGVRGGGPTEAIKLVGRWGHRHPAI